MALTTNYGTTGSGRPKPKKIRRKTQAERKAAKALLKKKLAKKKRGKPSVMLRNAIMHASKDWK